MRISTNTLYQSGISKIGNLQSEQNKLQLQVSTGKRILTPSDDPIAASRALELSAAKGIALKYADNRKTAETKLSTLETNLDSVTNLLVAAQSSVISAGNGAYSDKERSFVAVDLKNSLDSLISLANAKDESGNYLYAGFKTDVPAFVATAGGATYAGDSNQLNLQVDSSRLMPVSVTGSSVFQANSNDLFAMFSNLVNLLNTPVSSPAAQAALSSGIATAITSLQNGLDNVLNVRASVGSSLNELDTLNTAGSARDLEYKSSISDLEDLDYTSALSEYSKKQTVLEAAQKTFVATTGLSLFKYI